MNNVTHRLHREIDRVAGLLAEGCDLQKHPYTEVIIWYLADQAVSEAIELSNKPIPEWLHEKNEHRRKVIDLVIELSYYR